MPQGTENMQPEQQSAAAPKVTMNLGKERVIEPFTLGYLRHNVRHAIPGEEKNRELALIS